MRRHRNSQANSAVFAAASHANEGCQFLDGIESFGVGKRQVGNLGETDQGTIRAPSGADRTVSNLVRLSTLALALALGSAAANAEDWSPSPEPPFWSQTRQTLQGSGQLTQRTWLFMEAMDSPSLKAGEYLSNPARTSLGVEFDAAVLMQRKGQDAWEVRELRMRALCNQQRLQRSSAQGQWLDYVGRQDTSAKVHWICALPAPD